MPVKTDSIKGGYVKLTTRQKLPLIITSVVLCAAIFGVFRGFSVPKEKEQTVTHLTYTYDGKFSHQALELPSSAKTATSNPKYFLILIDSIGVDYRYTLNTEVALSKITTTVEVTATVACQGFWGSWQKQIELLPVTPEKGEFTVSFPVNVTEIQEMVRSVSKELGIESGQPDVTIKAVVHTKAEAPSGIVEDDFSQTTLIRFSNVTLEWDKNLAQKSVGYAHGLRYEQQGNFNYSIKLKPNTVFPEETLTAPPPEPEPTLVRAKVDNLLKKETLRTLNETFAYKFESSKPLKQIEHDVTITATLGSETLVLVPATKYKEPSVSIPFTIDIPFCYAVVEDIKNKTGKSPLPAELKIDAKVHTLGQSEFGKVEENLVKSFALTFAEETINIPPEPPSTEPKSGKLEETTMVVNSGATTARMGTLGLLGMVLVAFAYSAWQFRELKRRHVTVIQVDEAIANNKYESIVVDVVTLPEVNGETLVTLASLPELTKTADLLMKPILRLKEPDRHIYSIVDGNTRYQYISQEPPVPPPTKE